MSVTMRQFAADGYGFQLERNEEIVRAQLAAVQRSQASLTLSSTSSSGLATLPSSQTASTLFALSNVTSSLSKLAYFWRHFQRAL